MRLQDPSKSLSPRRRVCKAIAEGLQVQNIRVDRRTSLIITHDLGLAWNIADTVAVMKQGEIVEYGPVDEVLADPQHAYTRELLAAVPQLGSQSLVGSRSLVGAEGRGEGAGARRAEVSDGRDRGNGRG